MATSQPEVNGNDQMQKALISTQVIPQLDMLISVLSTAPERVRKAATEFRDALKEFASE